VPDPLLYKHNGATLPRPPFIPGAAFWITTSRGKHGRRRLTNSSAPHQVGWWMGRQWNDLERRKFGDFESNSNPYRGCRFCNDKLRLIRAVYYLETEETIRMFDATAASAPGTSKAASVGAAFCPWSPVRPMRSSRDGCGWPRSRAIVMGADVNDETALRFAKELA
jgi:hypothetical protein